MTSFGQDNTATSLRICVSETALINWYKILWNMVSFEDCSVVGVTQETIVMLEKNLVLLIHQHPRDDTIIVGGMMRVWGLCHYVQEKCSAKEILPFDDIVNNFDEIEMPLFLDTVAFYIAGNVPKTCLPLEYQKPGKLQCDIELCEITEQGILLLFALWHIKIMKQKTGNFCLPETTCLDIGRIDGIFTAQELKRLDAIHGVSLLHPQDIYSNSSHMNAYARIKVSRFSHEIKYSLSNTLFDFKPETYIDTLIGKTLLLSKKYKLVFCYGDEILWTSGNLLWLWFDAEVKTISHVVNGQTLFTTVASMQGLHFFCNYLASL